MAAGARSARLDVLGTCPRCDMLQVDQESGIKGGPDILIELARVRRLGGRGGRLSFGVLCANAVDERKGEGKASGWPCIRGRIEVGDTVRVENEA